MKWGTIIAIIMLIAIVACGPAKTEMPSEPQDSGTQVSEPVVKEEVTQPAQETPPAESSEVMPDETVSEDEMTETANFAPYTELGCEGLLSAETFASTCNQSVENIAVTYKVGTHNCLVNVKHRQEERFTAGITLTEFDSSEAAMTEFERRLKVFNVGADTMVGEKAYMFPKQNRETVNFVRGANLVEVGSDDGLCSKHDLVVLSGKVDKKLK